MRSILSTRLRGRKTNWFYGLLTAIFLFIIPGYHLYGYYQEETLTLSSTTLWHSSKNPGLSLTGVTVPHLESDSQMSIVGHVRTSHPRLFATAEQWHGLPAHIMREPYLSLWNQSIFDKAQALYQKPPIIINSSLRSRGSGILDEARQVQLRLKHWAYAYRMTKQIRWKDRIWEEIRAGTENFTKTEDFLVAFSFAYDWLYEAWTPTERETIMWSIIKLGLEKGIEAFEQNDWFLSAKGNWNCVTNAGMIIGSLAIYHDDPTENSRNLLPRSVQNARSHCTLAVYDDGTWSETPDYWYFGTQSRAELSSALLTATELAQHHLDASDAWSKTGLFHIYSSGPVGKFDYGDCGPAKITATANSLLFDGRQLQIPTYTLYQRDRDDVADPLSMFWYDSTVDGSWSDKLPLDRAFPDPRGAWVSMRSSWTDPEALFVAMKAGQLLEHQAHGNLDAGDFVLEALGERWAVELCHENYDVPGYFSSEDTDSQRWQYYRCGSIGQNTLLYNHSNQLVKASPSTTFHPGNNYTSSFWIADLTSAYEGVSSVRRGLKLLDERKNLLIQDEIIGAASMSQWRMHTTATVVLSEDNKVAVLHLNNKSISVMLQSPATAFFAVTPSVKLKEELSFPNEVPSQWNQSTSVLTVDVQSGNQTIALVFQPHWEYTQKLKEIPSIVSLDDWDAQSR
ncbi:hypothetical protein DM02DRAFT_640692 [Periconia macrospinosa]|uniref:Heparinase II/III family protein n=1 Tax=Periconia macrospinosa TaxID=97972 RepID=A0A2V1DYW7_9PLEO|nr:hypothetical protein DM02DRAFT_640692 [Periconia macrospinosa]